MKRLLALLLLLGCQASLEPGAALAGYFSNADAQLTATAKGMVFNSRCEHAEFGPVVLGANRDFEAESTVFTVSGNIVHSPNDRLRLTGHFDGDQLVLQVYVVRSEPPVQDPIVITLSPGGPHDTLVCNA
jgi:hypothetical protein